MNIKDRCGWCGWQAQSGTKACAAHADLPYKYEAWFNPPLPKPAGETLQQWWLNRYTKAELRDLAAGLAA